MEEEDEIIYQYYNLNTFDSIIKNKEIWFSDIKKMNDTNENEQVFIFLKNEFEKILEEISVEEEKQKGYAVKQELLKKIKDIAKEDKYKEHLLELNKYTLKKDTNKLKELKKKRNKIGSLILLKQFQKTDKFISCFSQKGDLLGQWRSYGDDGRGIAIGYKKNKLTEILQNLPQIQISIDKIEYLDENIDLDKIFKAFKKYEDSLERFDSLIESLSPNSKDVFERKFITHIIDTKLFEIGMGLSKDITKEDNEVFKMMKELYGNIDVSNFFKHSGFFEEKEVRVLIKKEKGFKLSEDKNKSYISENGFRISQKRDDYIEYTKLILSKSDFEMAVSEIIIGPNNNINEECMKKVLSKYGIKANVRKSRTPYRN